MILIGAHINEESYKYFKQINIELFIGLLFKFVAIMMTLDIFIKFKYSLSF